MIGVRNVFAFFVFLLAGIDNLSKMTSSSENVFGAPRNVCHQGEERLTLQCFLPITRAHALNVPKTRTLACSVQNCRNLVVILTLWMLGLNRRDVIVAATKVLSRSIYGTENTRVMN